MEGSLMSLARTFHEDERVIRKPFKPFAEKATMVRVRRAGPLVMFLAATSCAVPGEQSSAGGGAAKAGGQATVVDKESQPDIVRVAVGSKDHTTLVAALKAADLVNSLANAGPFTVFAPTNAAFDKLPAGTVDDLLKPANKSKLSDVLTHHVTTSARAIDEFTDGETVSMADGTNETIKRKDKDVFIGGAKIVGSVRATNGWVHVVDAVLVPAAKK
jgi:uncharacterized surface protein with fasciclin (FAS1) repeats